MNQTELQAELDKINQAIVAQEALRGIMSHAQIEAVLAQLIPRQADLTARLTQAAHQASVSGGGAVAQGKAAKAVGQQGVLVEGDVAGAIIIGSGNTINSRTAAEPTHLPPHLAPLRTQIARLFNKNELHALCFDLGIAADDLPGETRTALAQSLVAYCYQRERLPGLLRHCQNQRPNADWSQFSP